MLFLFLTPVSFILSRPQCGHFRRLTFVTLNDFAVSQINSRSFGPRIFIILQDSQYVSQVAFVHLSELIGIQHFASHSAFVCVCVIKVQLIFFSFHQIALIIFFLDFFSFFVKACVMTETRICTYYKDLASK